MSPVWVVVLVLTPDDHRGKWSRDAAMIMLRERQHSGRESHCKPGMSVFVGKASKGKCIPIVDTDYGRVKSGLRLGG